MAEPTDPKKGVGETSQYQRGPGVFGPAPEKEDTRAETSESASDPQTPRNSVDGVRHPRKINLEEERRKAVALEKATTLLKNAKSIKSDSSTFFDEDIFGVIISEMEDVKELLEKGRTLTPEMEKAISDGEAELEKIKVAIVESEQQNLLNKIEILYQKKEEYTSLKPFIESIEHLTDEGVPYKEEIISLFNELSWLEDFAKIKDFAKHNNTTEIQKIDDMLYELAQKKMDTETLLIALEKENEQLKRIVEEGEKQSEVFKNLENEAKGLKVLDSALITRYTEGKDVVLHTENEFYKSPSDVSLTKFDKALIKFQEIVSVMREKVVLTVPEPTVTPSAQPTPVATPTQTESEEQKPASPEPKTKNTTRYPDDISRPNISEDVHAKNPENKYRINIEGKYITVPWILLGTLNRYLAAFKDISNKEKDFSKAIELKDAVVNAIEIADFNVADEHARALGKELDTLLQKEKGGAVSAEEKDAIISITSETEGKDSPKAPETDSESSSSPESPEKEKKSVHWTKILPSFIEFNKETKRWAIKKGDEFIQMTAQEYSVWLPFITVLLQYRQFIVSNDEAYSYGDVVKKKNELLDALEKLDKERATLLAQELTHQFDPMIDKAVVPENEKTAARIRHEVRQSNLARLANEDAKNLDDMTARFAFIKEPRATASNEYRIISRQTGDWVPLKENDLAIVMLASEVLTKFKNRSSFTPECTQKKNEVLGYVNDYNFDAAKIAAEEYLKEFSKETPVSGVTKKNPLRPKVSGSEPSKTIEQNNLTKNFTQEKEKFTQTEDLLSKRLPLITSPLEQEAFTRLLNELKKLEQTLSENPTKESLELFEKHKKMFEKNPALYKELYGNESRVRDTVSETISAHILANTNIPKESEPERRKTILRNLIGTTPKEHLEGLAARKRALKGELQKLIADNLVSGASEEGVAKRVALEKELASIAEEEGKYAETILSKYTKKTEPELENNSILNNRQTYNPSKDPSLKEEEWEVNQNYETDENGNFVKIDNSTLTTEEINTLYETEPIPGGFGTDVQLVKKAVLSESDYPNHGKGIMESPRNDRDGTEPPHGLTNEDIGGIKNKIELEEQDTLRQEQEAKERAREKLTRGTKLFESLIKKVKPTTTKQWFLLGQATLGLAAGTSAAIGKAEVDKLEGRSLIDEMKKQSTWKNYVGEKVPKQFIKDFSGEGKLNYKDLIVKYVPSFGINQNNPATMDKFSNLVCKDVFSVLGANAGLNDVQQKEASDFINNSMEIMVAAKRSTGTLYREADIQSGAIFGEMTIQQYYDEVSKITEDAESERIRLQNIKR